MREIRTLRVMWRELETELRRHLGATAPVPDPTSVQRGPWAAWAQASSSGPARGQAGEHSASQAGISSEERFDDMLEPDDVTEFHRDLEDPEEDQDLGE